MYYGNYYAGSPYGVPSPPSGINQLAPAVKGRPVASLDEVRAAQIDFDGSIFIFPSFGNKIIYTKQIGLDGNAVIKEYSLKENDIQSAPEYVTKEEFNLIISELRKEKEKREQESKSTSTNAAIPF